MIEKVENPELVALKKNAPRTGIISLPDGIYPHIQLLTLVELEAGRRFMLDIWLADGKTAILKNGHTFRWETNGVLLEATPPYWRFIDMCEEYSEESDSLKKEYEIGTIKYVAKINTSIVPDGTQYLSCLQEFRVSGNGVLLDAQPSKGIRSTDVGAFMPIEFHDGSGENMNYILTYMD